MDGEAEVASGRCQRENKRSYKDFLTDVEDPEEAGSDAEEHSAKRPHKEPNDFLNEKMQHIGSSDADPDLHRAETTGFLPAYPVCVSPDRWTMTEEEENIQDNLLHSCSTAEGSIGQKCPNPVLEYWVYLDNQHNMADCQGPVSPSAPAVWDRPRLSIPSSVTAIATTASSTVSPVGPVCSATSSTWDTLRSTSRSPRCPDQDPVCAAAHLHLLGESLSLIGQHLQETNKVVCMSSSFSLLLDSLLCALAPLLCLTAQIPELRSCTRHTLGSTLENISYVMPGL